MGAKSYNNGTDMSRGISAAGFIRGNISSGTMHANTVLTDGQTFDVVAFINGCAPRVRKTTYSQMSNALRAHPRFLMWPET